MSSLRDIVSVTIDACSRPDGTIDCAAAVDAAYAEVMAGGEISGEEDAVENIGVLVRSDLAKRIKDAGTRASNSAANSTPAQGSFWKAFGLRERHALDIHARVLKETDQLTRLEFNRIREIRRDQIKADEAYLKLLDDAAGALAPIWDAAPEITFGQATAVYLASRQAAE